jgi:hypothetical protein
MTDTGKLGLRALREQIIRRVLIQNICGMHLERNIPEVIDCSRVHLAAPTLAV